MRFGFNYFNQIAYGSDGGGGGGGTNTVTNVQQIPQWQEDYIQGNEATAQSLASNPYPVYQAPLVAGLNQTQNTGLNNAVQNAYNYQPDLAQSNAYLNQANSLYGQSVYNPTAAANYGAGSVAALNPINSTTKADNALQSYTSSLNPANPGVVAQFMSPYVQNSLQPQLLQAGIQQAQQQNQINSQATGANAFGDARQGTMNALQNYYGQQTNAGIEAQGYNTAYNSALTAAAQQQQIAQQQVQNYNALGQLGVNEQGVLQNQQTLGLNQDKNVQSEQQINNQLAAQQAANALQTQNQALTAANAQYNAGTVQQQNTQAQLTAAYQQYLNQNNWPYQMLNVMESAVNSSPYQISSATTYPSTQNSTQAGINAFASLAGAAGSLTSKAA